MKCRRKVRYSVSPSVRSAPGVTPKRPASARMDTLVTAHALPAATMRWWMAAMACSTGVGSAGAEEAAGSADAAGCAGCVDSGTAAGAAPSACACRVGQNSGMIHIRYASPSTFTTRNAAVDRQPASPPASTIASRTAISVRVTTASSQPMR